MVLTDFDADGVRIAFDIEGITRIGIDFDTIKEINKRIELELKGDESAPEAPLVGSRTKMRRICL